MAAHPASLHQDHGAPFGSPASARRDVRRADRPGMMAGIDGAAFERFYADEYAPMVRMATTLVDSRQQAEEVVQDAFAAVYVRFDGLDRPAAYLRVTVLNGCRRLLRRRMLQRRQPIAVGDDAVLVFDHTRDAIRRLPHRQRSMIALRYDLQLTDAEIAATLDVPIGTVKSTLHRALAALRKELSDAR